MLQRHSVVYVLGLLLVIPFGSILVVVDVMIPLIL